MDEWYVRNASLGLDLRIIMMTVKVILRGRVSSQEILADTEQVQRKNDRFELGPQAKGACANTCSVKQTSPRSGDTLQFAGENGGLKELEGDRGVLPEASMAGSHQMLYR
jgi:hypothetical protein